VRNNSFTSIAAAIAYIRRDLDEVCHPAHHAEKDKAGNRITAFSVSEGED
jgi:hypothetical protein